MLILELAIGLGLFLYGMHQLEKGIESYSSSRVKTWLGRSTQHPASSVLTGTAITAIVQSSSMVSLMILAFASAGMIPLYNAIGVVLGANLGTTFTGWIVATLGFKLQLSEFAIPAVGLGCLLQVFATRQNKILAGGMIMFGLGMILFGLDTMKSAVESLHQNFDVSYLRDLNAPSFLLLGVLFTAVIQSSSATMMIALTALSSGIIELQGAAALIIGADLGTTSTTALGSIRGSPVMKQLALSHFIFNLLVDLSAFVLLLPLLDTLLAYSGLQDPLYSLVAFHSLFNLIGLLLFMPFLKPFSRWIGGFFQEQSRHSKIADVPTSIPEAAIEAISRELDQLLQQAVAINLRMLHLDAKELTADREDLSQIEFWLNAETDDESLYEQLKQIEGELLSYAFQLQQHRLSAEQAVTLNHKTSSARDAVYAVKCLRDIQPDLKEFAQAPEHSLQSFSQRYIESLRHCYRQIVQLVGEHPNNAYVIETLDRLRTENDSVHQSLHSQLHLQSGSSEIDPEELSTLLNVNREIWHSNRNIISALKHRFQL